MLFGVVQSDARATKLNKTWAHQASQRGEVVRQVEPQIDLRINHGKKFQARENQARLQRRDGVFLYNTEEQAEHT